ncbi:hypothetical protein CVT26_005614 [Gymnopilus dilepis]|uniref:Uncharacterized protein n=1 Tax=Gymnopilus dilepis TaxID=231916 RepID=A0A409XZP4_9AGAR|nr:hypothetical protein CVT26_005614 [Gymnopilus dilepis]
MILLCLLGYLSVIIPLQVDNSPLYCASKSTDHWYTTNLAEYNDLVSQRGWNDCGITARMVPISGASDLLTHCFVPKRAHYQQADDEEIVIDRREVEVRPKAGGQLSAGSFKKSSSTYRKAALNNGMTYTTAQTPGKVTVVKTPNIPPKGKDADHEFEAQTLKYALQKGGIQNVSQLGSKALDDIKDTLNHSSNLAFVDADINRKKGQATKSLIAGKTAQVSPRTKDYIKNTASSSISTAKSLDNVLRQHGITGVSVQKTQKDLLKDLDA